MLCSTEIILQAYMHHEMVMDTVIEQEFIDFVDLPQSNNRVDYIVDSWNETGLQITVLPLPCIIFGVCSVCHQQLHV